MKRVRGDRIWGFLLPFGPECFSFCWLSKSMKNKVQTSINFACFLCGCETWSFTCRLMLDTGVLEEVFEPKREDIVREWRKLLCEEFHNIFSFPDIIQLIKIRTVEWTVRMACMEGKGKCSQSCEGARWKTEIAWPGFLRLSVGTNGRQFWNW